MILNFMERYFYLICFSVYALEHGPAGFHTSFQQVLSKLWLWCVVCVQQVQFFLSYEFLLCMFVFLTCNVEFLFLLISTIV